ncbi:MAG TPA: hypothetical protein DCQ31_07065 [Bacteroidales bacterium]|nr:hypothetical protein [Bacteroidales bacterium]
MKNFKIKTFALVLTTVFMFSACDSWIDTDLNNDPNVPTVVPKSLILPSIHAQMGYSLGGNDAVLATNIWMQYMNGHSRQAYTIGHYQYTPSDCNNFWNAVYAGALKDAVLLKQISRAEGAYAALAPNGHYEGVANIQIAVSLGITSDLWGDIPYTEAFKGEEGNYNAKFDTQENIYKTIQTLLDEAIVLLGKPAPVGEPVTGDMVYGGNVAQWIKAAYGLKARYTLNLSKVNGNAAYTEALSYISKAMASNADNYSIPFGATDRAANPLFQFNLERGDANMCSTYLTMLNNASDPRVGFVATAVGGNYVGGAPGSSTTDGVSAAGAFVAGKSTAVVLMSYTELKFIEAEAQFRLGTDLAAALAAYKAAVAASVLQQTGAANTAWLDANINIETTATLTLEKIMTQKYLANVATVQSYNDWRRTGIPTLALAVDAIGQIPRRFPYAQEEITYNANTPKGLTTASKNWWDK